MTNSHVVHGASELRAQTPDGRESRADLIGDDPDTDLAVLRIDLPDLHHLPFADSGKITVGQIAIAIGYKTGDQLVSLIPMRVWILGYLFPSAFVRAN